MSELVINGSGILERNLKATTPLVINQGGTSSGKTWSILQMLILKAYNPGMFYTNEDPITKVKTPVERLHISICSIAMPHLKKGALKDFMTILTESGVYSEANHNKTDNIFKIGPSVIEFFSLDQPGKARGPRRDILFVNECNLIDLETYRQLESRTDKQTYIDFNPSIESHWIHSILLKRPPEDVTFIKSTYLDNPYLSDTIIKSIERYKTESPWHWTVFGLGEIGRLKGAIYSNWESYDMAPEGVDTFYGLDFGINVPTALVRCRMKENLLWVEELIYQSHVNNSELIEMLKSIVRPQEKIYADCAEPGRISEIRLAGFNIHPADKSVKDGLDRVRRLKVHYSRGSTNIYKEYLEYQWQEDANGNTLEVPVKLNDHALDAIRYAVHTHALRPSGKYAVR